MSYDLMVFEPSAAPRDRGDFLAWYGQQTEWSEPHSYSDTNVTSPNLRKWYEAITREFPDLNGPGVRDDEISDRHSEYSIGTNVIYASISWTEAEDAYDLVRRFAVEHTVGFYDASGDEGDGEIYFPGDTLRPPSVGTWRQIAAESREMRNQMEQQ
jgi:hypothetical protein